MQVLPREWPSCIQSPICLRVMDVKKVPVHSCEDDIFSKIDIDNGIIYSPLYNAEGFVHAPPLHISNRTFVLHDNPHTWSTHFPIHIAYTIHPHPHNHPTITTCPDMYPNCGLTIFLNYPGDWWERQNARLKQLTSHIFFFLHRSFHLIFKSISRVKVVSKVW